MRKLSFTDADLKVAAQEAWEAMAESFSDINHDELNVPAGYKERIMRVAKQYWENEKTGKKQRRRRALLRVAVIFIAILIGASAFFAVNTEARAVVQEWFRAVYERLVVYSFNGAHLEKTLPDYEPQWLPDGYKEVDRSDDNDQGRLIIYENESGATILFDYLYYEDDPITIEPDLTDELIIETTSVNGFMADLYYETNPDSPKTLIWVNEKDHIVFMINCVLEKEDIISIANSIRNR